MLICKRRKRISNCKKWRRETKTNYYFKNVFLYHMLIIISTFSSIFKIKDSKTFVYELGDLSSKDFSKKIQLKTPRP